MGFGDIPPAGPKKEDLSTKSPDDIVAGLRAEMGLNKKEVNTASKSAESVEVNLSPEENKRRRQAQSDSTTRAIKMRTEILDRAGVWTSSYIDEAEIQNALKPTLDELRSSASVLDYLAFKSMYDIGSHFIGNTINLNSIIGEDERIIEKAKKEILADDQRLELESRMNK